MRSELIALGLALAMALPAAAQDRASGRAAARAAEAARVAALPATGAPRRCLMVRNIRESRIIDRQTLLVRESASRWFRVTLPDACPGLDESRVIAWRAPTGQVCESDPFDVIDPLSRINHGPCTLGAFVPVDTRPPPAAPDTP